MTIFVFALLILLVSFAAGLFGALLGLGGGFIIVPALTLLFGIDIHLAIGASLVAVIATSSGAATTYVRSGIANLRVGMLLEVATAAGAIAGAWLTGHVHGRWLYFAFGIVLFYGAFMMLRGRNSQSTRVVAPSDELAKRLRLQGEYFDPAEGLKVRYHVARTRLGLAVSWFAGIISGLLGVGGGIIQVPMMHLILGMPMKAATATSNFMMGVTAAASAAIYFTRGDINPYISGPVALGVLLGAQVGTRIFGQTKSQAIRILFVIVIFWISFQMLLKGLH